MNLPLTLNNLIQYNDTKKKREKSRLKLDFVAAVEMMILISRSSDRIITRIVIVLKEAIYEEQCVP